MKTIVVRLFTAILALGGLAVASKAQVVVQLADQVVVKIPYEFVAAGKTLPAGTYKINRISDIKQNELVISGFENRTGALVISTVVEDAHSEQPKISFQVVGDQHFLSKIQTAEHIFTIPVSASAVPLVAKRKNAPSTSGTSGSN
jgi:hypothetical protein